MRSGPRSLMLRRLKVSGSKSPSRARGLFRHLDLAGHDVSEEAEPLGPIQVNEFVGEAHGQGGDGNHGAGQLPLSGKESDLAPSSIRYSESAAARSGTKSWVTSTAPIRGRAERFRVRMASGSGSARASWRSSITVSADKVRARMLRSGPGSIGCRKQPGRMASRSGRMRSSAPGGAAIKPS